MLNIFNFLHFPFNKMCAIPSDQKTVIRHVTKRMYLMYSMVWLFFFQYFPHHMNEATAKEFLWYNRRAYHERTCMWTLKWINGNSITHSQCSDWLLFKGSKTHMKNKLRYFWETILIYWKISLSRLILFLLKKDWKNVVDNEVMILRRSHRML